MVYALAVVLSGTLNPVLMTGPDALTFNPAQLAYPERAGLSCRILDFEAEVVNNSFSLAQYNRYTGAFLDDRAKADLLRAIPASGFCGRGRLEARTAQFGYGCLAMSVRTTAEFGAALPKDLFELTLRGNELGRTYRADPLDVGALMLLRTGIAGATAVGRNLSVGGAVHYLIGLSCFELTEGSAYFLTTPDALISQGRVGYRTAAGGEGLSFDIGVSHWSDRWRTSLAVLDLSPGVLWEDGIEDGLLTFELDTVSAYRLFKGEGACAVIDRGPGSKFLTPLPVRVNAGVARVLRENLTGCLTLRAVMNMHPAALLSVRPALSVEVWPSSWLGTSLRFSFETGNGLGLELGAVAVWRSLVLQVGFEDIGGLIMGARGAGMRISLGYRGFPAGTKRAKSDVLRLTPGVN
uniref:DUF5723 domain-containing protein n=1 Tax=candidate division WOR-3 bacterium TaxID=2052148 RepID=A0A7C4GHK3_UNCW3